MATPAAHPASPNTPFPFRPALLFLFAAASGLTAANLYFAQPLVGLISRALDLRESAAGLVVTISQLGYAAGLLLLAPLGDLLENRRLICTVLLAAAVAECVMGSAGNPTMFFGAAFAVGVCSVAAQMLVAFAANLAPDASRGRIVGNVMSGLMFGILFARPISSFIASFGGWRAVFFLTAGIMVILVVALRRGLPMRQPATRASYGQILRSMISLFLAQPVLRRRAAYQFFLFGTFSLFWTASPLLLEGEPFHLSQRAFAVFALAGAAGAVMAPIAGRWADRGWVRVGSGICMALVVISFGIAHIGALHLSEITLIVAAIVLDGAVAANLVFGQRSVFALAPEARSRLNALFIAIFFLGGAAGSFLAGWAFAHGGWSLVCKFGAGAGLAALAIYCTEFIRRQGVPAAA